MSTQATSTQPLEFKFVTARPSLQKLFPFDPNYDIEITFHKNKYELKLAYLKIESDYFKKNKLSEMLEIKQDFDEEQFENIFKCFYGGTYKCPRNEIFSLWTLLQYFKINIFKKVIIKDIKSNPMQYNIFELMAFGSIYNIDEIFNQCLIALDNQNFSQIKRSKDIFLGCPLDVFKFIINTHNRMPSNKKCLSYIEINNLLSEYFQRHQFSEEFQKQLKFELIQKTHLTSEEYNHIFLGGGFRSQSTKQIPDFDNGFESEYSPPHSNNKPSSKSKLNVYVNQSTQLFSPSKQKLNSEEKHHWKLKLKELKDQFLAHESDYRSMSSSVTSLSNSLKRKTQQAKEKDSKLTQFEKMIRDIQRLALQKSQSLKKIEQRVSKLQSSSNKKGSSKAMKEIEKQQQEQDQFVQSHIIPGFVLGDMLAPQKNQYEPTASTANFSKKKKSVYESNRSDENVDLSYRNSLLFDKQPTSVPRKYLSNLAKFLETDQFMKKKELNLLFRRSSKSGSFGDPNVIKNRSGLLALFQTDHGKHAGGFISVQIPSSSKSQNICDYQSFIFSLTNNAKFPIIKGEQKCAIALSKHYILSFANDLMISTDCLNEESYSEWPSLYEGGKSSMKNLTVKDFVGGNEFKVVKIEIYEVKNKQVEMVI